MKIFSSAAIAVVVAFAFPLAHAADNDAFDTITVTANYISHEDTEAAYPSEIHTADQIKASGVSSLYDYLDKQTSLVVMPSYGNPFSQLIDMRGYGIGDGYQNIVVNLDGRRLNNIDMSPQLLSAIALESIDRIEIAKGSGSVVHGDGAMAGVINIYTRPASGVGATASLGNYGVNQVSGRGGFNSGLLDLSLYADQYQQAGFSDPDVTGKRDEADKSTLSAKMALRPSDRLAFDLGVDSSRIDTRYPGPLSLTEYRENPAQNSGNTYTHQEFATDSWNFGGALDLLGGLKLRWDHGDEEKRSAYVTTGWTSDYHHRSDRLTLNYSHDALSLVAGGSLFAGERIGATNSTHKDNSALFLQGEYRWGDTLLALGARTELVEYLYAPNGGARLNGEHELSAWEAGLNRRLSDRMTVFSNYSKAFQAPDIDRFFDWTGAFNGFILPARSETVNLGVNFVGPHDRLKLTLFHTGLKNEIYYDSLSFTNTNIDRSHKYGLEVQDEHRFGETLSGHLNYTYTQAVIDQEDQGGGTYDGKELPGVSRHGLSLSLNWELNPRSRVNLSHTFRSEAYATTDFANSFSQRQEAYHSTDLSYSHRLRDQVELVATVKNLFEESNGIWVQDDTIYPVNFTRNWGLGVKVSL